MTEHSPNLPAATELSLVCGEQVLACKRWGHPGQPLILALHGWRDNAASFDRLAPLLQDHQVLALDFAGHGLSSPRHYDGNYSIWSYLDDVLAVLAELDVASCLFLGHSMGGAVATLFAGLFPERVERMVLLDSIGPLTVPAEGAIAQMRRSLLQNRSWDPAKKSYYPSLEAAIMARAHVGLEFSSAQLLANRGVSRDEGGYYWHTDRRLALANRLSLTEAHVQAFLAQINCPTLFIQASDEQYWQRQAQVIDARMGCVRQLQHSRLNGHHHQHLEGQVEAVAQLTQVFLTD